MMKFRLLCAAAVVLTAPATALAQDSVEPDDSGSLLEDVIVTAERRESNVQDVPITVSTFTGDQLEGVGVTTAQELNQITPGLNFIQSAAWTQPTIRGMGVSGTSPGDESSVAVYVDGVYQASTYALNLNLSGIERIEILKGPQGTLFGRNATGGAINVILPQPSFTPVAHLEAAVGSFDRREVSLRLSGPVTETVAYNLTGHGLSEGGFIEDIGRGVTVGGQDEVALNGSVLFSPNDRLDITLAGSYLHRINRNSYTTNALRGNTRAQSNAPGSVIATAPWQVALSFEPFVKVLAENIRLRAAYEFDGVSATFLSSYSEDQMNTYADNDITPNNFATARAWYRSDQTINELHFASNGEGAFSWLMGLTHFQYDAAMDPFYSFTTTFNGGGLGATVLSQGTTTIRGSQSSEAWSGYFEGTYAVADRLFLTAGVRYTDEARSFRTSTESAAGAVAVGAASAEFENTSLHASTRYEFSDDANVYFSYAEGFKSGLFNATSIVTRPVEPEEAESFEVGLKANLGRNLRINTAIYRTDYDNLQAFAALSPGVYQTTNAAAARIEGVDLQIYYNPFVHTTLYAGVSIADARYLSFPNAQGFIPNAITSPPSGNSTVTADVSGNSMTRTPDFTFNIGGEYDRPFAGGELTFSANVFYSSGHYIDFLNLVEQPEYVLANASVAWAAPGDRLTLGLRGQNLTDEPVISHVTVSNQGYAASYQRPRTFALFLEYDIF